MVPANVEAGAVPIEHLYTILTPFCRTLTQSKCERCYGVLSMQRYIEKETAMIRNIAPSTSSVGDITSRPRRLTRGLQAALWALWTLAVAAGGVWSWWADLLAGRPLSLVGMAINAMLVGIIGLIVLTKIEMRLEPWRFLD